MPNAKKRNYEETFGGSLYDLVTENRGYELQRKAAVQLRENAIDHLRNGKGVVARAFRGEYVASGLGHYSDFLDRQSKDKAWGTYLEATAIGEKYNLNVIVTPVTNGKAQEPICLYRPEDENAPTVHLYNDNNVHWRSANDPEHTLGDGNCLYNALAQEFAALESKEAKKACNISDTPTQQLAIKQAVEKQEKPSTMAESFESEKSRIVNLPVEEQKQIESDYQLALKLAREELNIPKPFPTGDSIHRENIDKQAIDAQQKSLQNSPPPAKLVY